MANTNVPYLGEWLEGYHAHEQGKILTANPHEAAEFAYPRTPEGEAWQNGWNAASEEARGTLKSV